MLRQQVQGPKARGLAQAFGAGLALGLEQQRGLPWVCIGRTRAAFEPCRSTQQAQLRIGHLKARLGEGQRALDFFEHGQTWNDGQVVAGQRHAALHLAVFNVHHRDGQFEFGLQVACAFGFVECTLQELAQR